MQICTCELPPILRWFTRTKTGTRGRGIGSRPAARSIQRRTNRCICVTNIMFVLYHLERRDVFCPDGGIRAILIAFVCHAKRSLLGFRHTKREKGSPRHAKRTFSGGGHGNRPRAVGFCGRHHKRRPRQARVEEALARCKGRPARKPVRMFWFRTRADPTRPVTRYRSTADVEHTQDTCTSPWHRVP